MRFFVSHTVQAICFRLEAHQMDTGPAILASKHEARPIDGQESSSLIVPA